MAVYGYDTIALSTPEKLYAAAINTMLEDSDFLRMLPLQYWGTGRYAQYNWTTAFPVAQAYDDDDTINETVATRYPVQVFLKRYAEQFSLENFQLGVMSAADSNAMADAFRGLSLKLRTDSMVGVSTTVAIGATAGTKGIDAVVPGPRTPDGLGYLSFDDTADTISYMAPGDTAYGTAVSTATDLAVAHHYLYSSNPSKWIRITMDVSDSEAGGDWVTTNAATGLTFTTSKTYDGLMNLVDPVNRVYGNLHATTPTANGDDISLAGLDWIIRTLKGPKSEFAIFAPPRTVDAVRQLVGGAGGTTPTHWQGMELSGAVVPYRGIPVIPEETIPITQTVGSTTNCGSVIGVRFNPEMGVLGFYGNPNGPLSGINDDTTGSPLPMPIYLRRLAEKVDKDQIPTRVTNYSAVACKQNQAIAELQGIKN